jgi:hypothetical protein
MVAEEFMANAKDLCQRVSKSANFWLSEAVAIANASSQIMLEKQLRGQPFSDTVLREMAIKLPQGKRVNFFVTNVHTNVRRHDANA